MLGCRWTKAWVAGAVTVVAALVAPPAHAAIIRVQSDAATIRLTTFGDPLLCGSGGGTLERSGSLFFGGPLSLSSSYCGVTVSASGSGTFLSTAAGGGAPRATGGSAEMSYRMVFDVLGTGATVALGGPIALITPRSGQVLVGNALPEGRYELVLEAAALTGIVSPSPGGRQPQVFASFGGVTAFEVPTPATIGLLAMALVGVGVSRRRAASRDERTSGAPGHAR